MPPASCTWATRTNNTIRVGLGANPSVSNDFDRDGKADLDDLPALQRDVVRPEFNHRLRRPIRFASWASAAMCRYRATTMATASGILPCVGPPTGVWYILTSSSNYVTTVTYTLGVSGDIPVPGDYDDATASPTLRSTGPAPASWHVL